MGEKIKQMKLEEKASLCSGATPWTTETIKRLNIPGLVMADGPHGLRVEKKDGQGSKPATCFPTASALASSWDKKLVNRVGEALAKECQASGVDILLGPGINIKRTPLCGRNFEYFSEDPYLTGELASRYVQGVQSKGIGTSLKHFTANNQEAERFSISAEINERTLREIYLPAFKKVVKEAGPWTVMCAYNKINGIFGSEHKYLLTDILRNEWGFEGFVVSDWEAVHDRVKGLKAGLDLEMPGPSPLNDRNILKAVKSGELDEGILDRTVERIIRIVEKAAAKKGENIDFDLKDHHSLAREIAGECMVLLKNENNILPINKEEISSLGVIGQLAVKPRFEGGGSSHVNATGVDIPLTEIKKLAPENLKVDYAEGYLQGKGVNEQLIEEAKKVASLTDRAIIFVGLPEKIESEGYDRSHLRLPENQIKLINAVTSVQNETIVVLQNGSAVVMDSWIDRVPSILEAWYTGQAGGGAIADVLFGKVNPSGRLAESFPVKLEDTPAYLNYPGEGGKVRYGEGIFVGYRYYDKKDIEPLFPFGYGLSYTTFEYSNLSIKELEDTEEGLIEVRLTVANKGELEGKEVVQLYIGQDNPSFSRPPKELRGFKKVELEPAQEKRVTFRLHKRDFSYYNTDFNKWWAERDNYQIMIGRSSRDIVLSEIYTLDTGREKEKVLNSDTPTSEWLNNKQGKRIIEEILSEEQLAYIEQDSFKFSLTKPIYRLANLSKGKIKASQIEEILSYSDDV